MLGLKVLQSIYYGQVHYPVIVNMTLVQTDVAKFLGARQ